MGNYNQYFVITYMAENLKRSIRVCIYVGLSWRLSSKESTCDAGDAGDAGSSLGQWATVHGVINIHACV